VFSFCNWLNLPWTSWFFFFQKMGNLVLIMMNFYGQLIMMTLISDIYFKRKWTRWYCLFSKNVFYYKKKSNVIFKEWVWETRGCRRHNWSSLSGMRSERNRYNRRKSGVEMRNTVRQWVEAIEKAELAEEKVI